MPDTLATNHATTASQGNVVGWLGSFLRPYKLRVITALICLLIGSLAWLALGQGVKLIVDEGFVAGNAARLNQLVWVLVGIAAISSSAVFCRFYLMSWLGERVSNDIRARVYDNLLTLPPAFYARLRTGEVISRFTADSTLLQTVIGSSFSMALRSFVSVLGGIAMMAITSVKLTALVLVAVPAVLVPILIFGRKVRALSRDSQDRVADLGAYIDESLHEIHTVQSYTHEQVDRHKFGGLLTRVLGSAGRRIQFRALLIAGVMFLTIAAIALMIWVGARDVMSGAISAGELSAFLFYALLVAGATATISEVIGDVQRASGAAERLKELSEAVSEVPKAQEPVALPSKLSGDIRIEGLSFSYPGTDVKALDNISVHIRPGEKVALVGESGAGKSTLFQLLGRFYAPDSGAIYLDGTDIANTDLQALRRAFALVPQESVIFADSVLENVRYGKVDASFDEVKAACVAARAHDFIEAMPEGYHSYLGERGVKLSGGQKQRIAIARAILASRPVLLLDEATSALDAVSERNVKEALDTLICGRTSLIIAHRLATVINADRILVMDKGKIIAEGSHTELLESSQQYREFASLQLLTEA
ncbi:ABC transporter transmembrane domain-containing protein [Shewanella sp. FJAT-52076]|uniref:ABC transporter transmembrane domain-containing protein n=1 Tax=Shewanella sp. FJAT-52076 TaxID=2864202 RepID=UPI001C660CAE|nr:ABC transporter transmembrane domain-containing protein [Shewanella sp. FJAT-52076]QYJ74666.1 ATP-binding cassette domain-containing protein [Shewanella sp. FJAT-52076]